MSYLKFNHVFLGLMLLAFLSAFVISPKNTDRVRASTQNVFAPIAWPVNRVGGWAHAKLATVRDPASPKNPRTETQVLIENRELRVALSSAQGQLARLLEREADRAKLGNVRTLCTPFSVVGGDAGPRESLMLAGSSFDGIRLGMPVLYTGGIAGRVSRVGVGGAQVLLVTDSQSKFTASFARLVKDDAGAVTIQRLTSEPILVEGAGRGRMTARITRRLASEIGLRESDIVVLSDRDWPLVLEGYHLGYIEAIAPARDAGFSQATIRPDENLLSLREVMVMNKEKG